MENCTQNLELKLEDTVFFLHRQIQIHRSRPPNNFFSWNFPFQIGQKEAGKNMMITILSKSCLVKRLLPVSSKIHFLHSHFSQNPFSLTLGYFASILFITWQKCFLQHNIFELAALIIMVQKVPCRGSVSQKGGLAMSRWFEPIKFKNLGFCPT